MDEVDDQDTARAEKLALYAAVFGNAAGMKVLADLRRVCGAGQSAFDAASERRTCFVLGRQDVFAYLEKMTKGD